jgi:hypothetical protein
MFSTTTSALETEFSSRTKEASRLNCGSERGTTPFCSETSSGEYSLALAPTGTETVHRPPCSRTDQTWFSFLDLKLMFADSRHYQQLSLCPQQCIVTTVEDSVLRTEMVGLESQEEDAPKRILFFKAMSWLGLIRSHRRDEVWSTSL